ncbi:MAG: phosphoenolpyruvate--protein phosphotransferase [Candidatus Accumulibacter phosphatis]|uniref:Phosphoenolpyruvate-protein phosphotransferase n=2 Tax=Candidatus Accumulibacter TaxID=327159 RepID=A0A080M9Q2_9PROT|nr:MULTISPECIES: phosphoenolpyruvate--protein phosphotransferase [Candidatus Accumulibacter]KFB78027.1 MAG: Phosphoenolpyruvate-protein phosphotransferase [Candidatus Accumulibacter cognatus]MBL8402349.1 phosphoenolpyruvate--protein phosphotransferase [Accumulibacter sp.]MBN8518315.1 phosphoenolpyruvate--protein phosphotransferase [Accumulibacter sp.]MBO3712214.1 phosphoenolpyruvate--protein phosphotransferase [Accumulibacter sp.]MCC2867217.1 phosphoenolpyruvate--protein phosphotransferase [Ca
MSFTLHGLAVSGGIAIGQAHLMSHATLEVSHLVISPRLVDKEVARFEAALLRVREEFATLKGRLQHTSAEFGAFIDLHSMILADPELAEVPKQLIRERRCNAEWALVQQMEILVAQFESFDDPYLRERSYDVRQVVERVIKELVGQPGRMSLRTGKGIKEENLIVVAHDLSPADVIAYKEHHFAAFVTDVGGSTSHTAILARSLRIPAVLGLHNARQLIHDDEVLIVDGTRGVLIVNPDPRILEEYRLRKSQIELERIKLRRLKTAKSVTLDGVDIDLQANIELPGDVAAALDGGAEGIGLFRTEFIFLDRGDMPTEDEQFEAYRAVVKGMGGRPVTIRTFDLGSDKDLHPEKAQGERLQSNPALGLRAIRLSLAEPKMFQTQLRAILRASKFGKIKLLIPMLSQAHEIDQTLAAVERAKSSLRGERIPFDETIQVGAMIEIPAAALAVGLFLRRMHFLSIGTNDLIQYTLAIDRSDEEVAPLYDPLHPAVLMLLAHTIASAEKMYIPVSICGELAGDPTLTRLLLGMGLRQFSMHPAQILSVKQKIMQSNCAELAPIVRRLLRHEEPAKIREQLEKLNSCV